MYRNTSKLTTGKSPEKLLFNRRLWNVFDNVHPGRQPWTPKHVENLRIFQPDQPVWERKHSKDLWKPAVVVNQYGNMCYKVLLEGDVVALRHADQLRKWCQTNGKTLEEGGQHTWTQVLTGNLLYPAPQQAGGKMPLVPAVMGEDNEEDPLYGFATGQGGSNSPGTIGSYPKEHQSG
ncbi:hypothetical protein PR048_003119 [Dryococelus australis]|uniref:Uncharacterized protein n=1 Tax=Dryococelus australis TaxID=614101 RepID=A0ABQ9IM83_9NEOP|nr:hypothetical protein PR048_003119 [Dryococelus australis]